ncbi:MAG: PP2C family protein-serine/threonine phosphatase [Spirochaetes bacterium]|nr:PP2C family protein-serine/threonine phosphatase [Spirochaetota bacterium]
MTASIVRGAREMTATIHLIDFFSFIVLALLVSLAISVFIHNRSGTVNRLFALFLLDVAAWLFVGYLYNLFTGLLPRLLLLQIVPGSLMGALFYYFSRAVAGDGFRMGWREWLVLLPPLLILLAAGRIALSPALMGEFSGMVWISHYRLHRPKDALYVGYSIYLIAAFVAGYAVMIRGAAAQRDRKERNRILQVLFASILGQISGLVLNNLLTIVGFGQYGYYSLVPIFLSLAWIAYLLIRHRMWAVERLLEIIQNREAALEEHHRSIEADLDLARIVQQRLLPSELPSVPGLVLHALYIPAGKVGGDFYDFRWGGNRLDIIVADVSGHGIASAFLSSMIKAAFHGNGGPAGPGLLGVLDSLVEEKGAGFMFATAVCCSLEIPAGRLRCSRAGHCYPLLLRRDGEPVELKGSGRGLGFGLGPGTHQELCLDLHGGDRLVIFTDGITEAFNGERSMFGEGRLMDAVRGGRGMEPREFCGLLLGRLEEFAGPGPWDDDITLVVVDIDGG